MMDRRAEIVIIGAGPTGLVLGNLLGALGVSTVILERDTEVFPVPRATHMDEETVRNLALTGLMEQLLPHLSPFGNAEVADRHGNAILSEPIGIGSELHGTIGSCFFHQPGMEQVLRDGLGRFACVRLLTGVECVALKQDDGGVSVSARQMATGEMQHLRASYAVGCDGGRSLVRGLLGIAMRQMAPPRRWLIVDARLRDAADASLLPHGFRYRMGLSRLSLYAHGHGLNRRWEFRLYGDEPAPTEEQAMRWVADFIDPHRLEVLRITSYSQNALIAEQWRKGRVLLAGDAAHLMPPAAGQGMCSGIRDAVNLAWKLHHVLQRGNGDALLRTYRLEREPHLTAMLRASLFISGRVNADSVLGGWWKYAQMLTLGRLHPLRGLMRHHLMRPVPLADGFLDAGSGGGQHLPCMVADGTPSDRLWPYGWAVFSASGSFGPSLALRLSVMGISAISSSSALQRQMGEWLHGRHAEYAIVRPDRIVYALADSTDVHARLDALEQAGIGSESLQEALAASVKAA